MLTSNEAILLQGAGTRQQRFHITFHIEEVDISSRFCPTLSLTAAGRGKGQRRNLSQFVAVRNKAQTGFKQTHTRLLTLEVVAHRLHQTSQQISTHHGHLSGDRVQQCNRCIGRIHGFLNLWINKAVSNGFLITTSHHLATQIAHWQTIFRQTRQRRCGGRNAYRQVFIAVNTGQLFNQIRLNGHIKTVAWRNHIPAVFGRSYLHTQTGQNVFNFAVFQLNAKNQLCTGTTQMNLSLLWQVFFCRYFHHRARLAAADIQNQRGGTFHGFGCQVVVHTTLKTVGRICVQTVVTGTTGNRQWAEESRFQQQILSIFRHT